MRVVRLCRGSGDGKTTACLTTAISIISGRPEELDEPSCLCTHIAALARPLNDDMEDDVRACVLGDLPWMLIGTVTDDREVLEARAHLVLEYAILKHSPVIFTADHKPLDLHSDRTKNAVKGLEHPELAAALASKNYAVVEGRLRCIRERLTRGYSVQDKKYPSLKPGSPLAIANVLEGLEDAASLLGRSNDITSYSYEAVVNCSAAICGRERQPRGSAIWRLSRQMLLGMAAIGSRTPVEPVFTLDQLAAKLSAA